MTTTSTGADAVTAWFEWWNAVWGYDVEIVNVTGALAAVNLAGPLARQALGRLVEDADDVGADAFKYLDAKHLEVAGVPTLALRIGFVGELGYELHFPSPAGEHLWDALVGEGAQPFGLEPQRVLRLEKGHVIVGQDTDSESNLYSSGMSEFEARGIGGELETGALARETNWWGAFVIGLAGTVLVIGLIGYALVALGGFSIVLFGIIVRIPRIVANVAPSRIPSQHGMNMPEE